MRSTPHLIPASTPHPGLCPLPNHPLPTPLSRQLPHAPESPVATLSPLEKRAINLTWAKPFDGNSPLLRYVVEVSENSKRLLPAPGQSLISGITQGQRARDAAVTLGTTGLISWAGDPDVLQIGSSIPLPPSSPGRCALGRAAGQRGPRADVSDGAGLGPRSLLPVPPLRREQRGQGTVQQGHREVSRG